MDVFCNTDDNTRADGGRISVTKIICTQEPYEFVVMLATCPKSPLPSEIHSNILLVALTQLHLQDA